MCGEIIKIEHTEEGLIVAEDIDVTTDEGIDQMMDMNICRCYLFSRR